jgi:hypothetical protein
MTDLLQKAMGEIERLPIEQQNEFAERILAELSDDATWDALFAKTTDAQLQRMEQYVQQQIDRGEVEPLESIFDLDKNS